MNESTPDRGIGRRITRYGMFLTLSGILCKILLLVYTVLAVDILGKKQFGRIEYYFELAIIFSVLFDFGLEQTVTRELARQRKNIWHSLYPLTWYRFAVSIVGSFVLFAFLALVRKPEHSWGLVVAAAVYFFIVLNVMLIRAAVRSLEWLALESWANILDKIAHIGLAITLLYVYPSLPALLLCIAAGAWVSLVIYWWAIIKELGWHRRAYALSEWVDWQKLAVPIGLSAACILLLHRQDTVMVNWIRGDIETGLYRAPYRFLEGLFLFPQVLAISAYPVFSKLFHDNQPFTNTAALLLRGLFLISLPIAAGGTVVAHDMMMSLTPDLGAEGGWVFLILVWSLPVIYPNFILGTMLNASDRQHENFIASAWGLSMNALLNIPAIYFYGAYGAAVVTAISQGFYGLLMFYDLREYSLIDNAGRYAGIVASVVLMVALLYWLALPWLLAVFVGAVVYGVAILLLRGITLDDLHKLKRVVRGD